MLLKTALLAAASLSSSALAAFGVTKSGSNFVVDAGSTNSLVFIVDGTNCDITSIKFLGEEFQYSAEGSQISSGLGSATVSSSIIGTTTAKITCVTSTLTHYYVVKSGDPTIYMATYTTAEPTVGELRYIARLNTITIPSEYPFGIVSTTANATSTVEGSDVFMVDGQTRSKFYSSERFIDDARQCVYRGTDVHVCMLLNSQSYESSSGGPFHRDINSNNAGTSNNLYFYMNSNHVQLDSSYRMGLHGPYAMTFSRSGIPSGGSSLDTSFFENLSITGYVPASARGTVTGTATGVGSGFQIVLHWFNSAAQYWVYADSTGKFTSPAMKPGTYTQVLYQGEFKVQTSTVTVTAGSTTTANIAAVAETRTSVWRIGDWDGQPTGFRNAANHLRMHPTDTRMASWATQTYTVGSSTLDAIPMAIVMGINTVVIKFTGATGSTLRIGTTLAFSGCRPGLVINSWTATTPDPPAKLDSRGLTRGAYRGFGEVYNFDIPAGTLTSGTNTATISCVSGNTGDGFLAPNVILDAIELFK